jgi:hypothetical protein
MYTTVPLLLKTINVAQFVIEVSLGSKFCPSALEILVLQFLLGISDTSLCSLSAPQVKIVLLLGAHQLLLLCEATFTCSKSKLFILIVLFSY